MEEKTARFFWLYVWSSHSILNLDLHHRISWKETYHIRDHGLECRCCTLYYFNACHHIIVQCTCMHADMRVCVRACARACVCVCVCARAFAASCFSRQNCNGSLISGPVKGTSACLGYFEQPRKDWGSRKVDGKHTHTALVSLKILNATRLDEITASA